MDSFLSIDLWGRDQWPQFPPPDPHPLPSFLFRGGWEQGEVLGADQGPLPDTLVAGKK